MPIPGADEGALVRIQFHSPYRDADTVEDALGLSRDQLRYSWQVLKNYGNMSSATALFVLKEAFADKARGRFLLAAFGPGFSGYFIVLEL